MLSEPDSLQSLNPNLEMNWWTASILGTSGESFGGQLHGVWRLHGAQIFGEGLINIVEWIKFRMFTDINMSKSLTQKQYY